MPRSAAVNGTLEQGYIACTGLPRRETLVWLLRAMSILRLPDCLLMSAMQILDRKYAQVAEQIARNGGQQPAAPDTQQATQLRLFAAVSVALKTMGQNDGEVHFKHVLQALGNGTVEVATVLQAELTLLRDLKFEVTAPVALEFLDTLGARLRGAGASQAAVCLADMLMQLSLAHPACYYAQPHAVLAGAALSLGLWITKAPPHVFELLMEDLMVFLSPAENDSDGTASFRPGARVQFAGPREFADDLGVLSQAFGQVQAVSGTSCLVLFADMHPTVWVPQVFLQQEGAGMDRATLRVALARAAGLLHTLWVQSRTEECAPFAHYLRLKFANGDRCRISEVVPPALPLPRAAQTSGTPQQPCSVCIGCDVAAAPCRACGRSSYYATQRTQEQPAAIAPQQQKMPHDAL
jgi:hypothetical protein